jgi:hypothetical protein
MELAVDPSFFAPSVVGADEVRLFPVHGHDVLSCRIAAVGYYLSGLPGVLVLST